jgi:hypothetical protein
VVAGRMGTAAAATRLHAQQHQTRGAHPHRHRLRQLVGRPWQQSPPVPATRPRSRPRLPFGQAQRPNDRLRNGRRLEHGQRPGLPALGPRSVLTRSHSDMDDDGGTFRSQPSTAASQPSGSEFHSCVCSADGKVTSVANSGRKRRADQPDQGCPEGESGSHTSSLYRRLVRQPQGQPETFPLNPGSVPRETDAPGTRERAGRGRRYPVTPRVAK